MPEQATCQNCKHHASGVSHGYLWQTCKNNWSDDRLMIGVVQNVCKKHSPIQQKQGRK